MRNRTKQWPAVGISPRSTRRGVLLIVVLSILVLFMLIGTAFLMSSSHSRVSAKYSGRKDRLGNHATRLLDRANRQLIRDSENKHSVIRYHSLLRDLYGTDGFQGAVYNPATPLPSGAAGNVTRFAGATTTPLNLLGQTGGQFIDVYVRTLAFSTSPAVSADDPATPEREDMRPLPQYPDLRHVVKLDRNVLGQSQLHVLPQTRGYYNGCLLTVTSGPATGQSARIVDYEYIADISPSTTTTTPAIPSRLYRFRVMAFPRADGTPLEINRTPERSPELSDLAGATFIVNGRPFNGTGIGNNPFAAAGKPRLTALELLLSDGTEAVAGELALMPNAAYFNPLSRFPFNGAVIAPFDPAIDPFTMPFPLLSNTAPVIPFNVISQRLPVYRYHGFTGPGDADESYDAADFQNMLLALLTVTPRAQGRVVHSDSGTPIYLDPNDPDAFENAADFLRLDLEDLPLPSFHRPDLVNFWYHRLLMLIADVKNGGQIEDEHVRALFQPWRPDGTPTPPLTTGQAYLISAVKRKIMMRPSPEDHPNFNGSNTQSLPADLGDYDELVKNGNIAIPYWEAVGPWDVDNDNDNVNDSIWVDLGDPVLEFEDGTRYKTLYAILAIDLDSRLNVNAHGLVDHIDQANQSSLAWVQDPADSTPPYTFVQGPNLAGTNLSAGILYSTNLLSPGIGYGPAEISLRPVFPAPWVNVTGGTLEGNRVEDPDGDGTHDPTVDLPIDSYAAVLVGRHRVDESAVVGRYGYEMPDVRHQLAVTPGLNYQFTPDNVRNPTVDQRAPDLAAQLKFFNYPWLPVHIAGSPIQYYAYTAFGTPPDLFGRYALGIDYTGQPVYEVPYDRNAANVNFPSAILPRPLLTDSPYELNLSGPQRRDEWSTVVPFADAAAEFAVSLDQSDDAAFAPTDLERVLRAWDADSGTLPSRLWDAVDVFDPVKLMSFDWYRVAGATMAAFGVNNPQQDSPEALTAAQQIAAINRRLVTTDSFDLPVPGGGVPNQVALSLGADGQPGRSGSVSDNRKGDDDGDGEIDEADEINAAISDDFRSLFGKEVTQATVFDLLRYRVWVQVRNQVMLENGWDEAALENLNTTPNYRDFLALVSQRAEAMLNGEPFSNIDTGSWTGIYEGTDGNFTAANNINGNRLLGQAVYDPPLAQLLAPEVIAGKRMDLNRPLGDGRDNGDGFDNDDDGAIDELEINEDLDDNGVIDNVGEPGDKVMNGVVDDPLEAGEPFLDINGNGKRDDGSGGTPVEPFINIDGSLNRGTPTYTPPVDQLWQGLTAEPITFDYTNGQGEPVHASLGYRGARLRNIDFQSRQHYARHLYCLMLLLVDENYIAPWDENDPQIMTYLGGEKKKLTDAGVADALADFIAKRKLTCRTIAQWAVNCVDMRDADAIMTPFEYDENPWDGWGCPDDSKSDGVSRPVHIPLDGDPATDENKGEIIDWVAVAGNGQKTIKILATLPNALNQTRGLVWGAERPELLITETVAFHDRRTEDLMSPDSDNGHDSFQNSRNPEPRPQGERYADYDMDQSLRPRGSLFVELYNPNTPDGQRPPELYTKLDSATGYSPFINQFHGGGVELGRLSNLAVDDNGLLRSDASTRTIRRSPVWRIIVVEEDPGYRSREFKDTATWAEPNRIVNDRGQSVWHASAKRDERPQGLNVPTAYEAAATDAYTKANTAMKSWAPKQDTPLPPFRPTNPDFTEVFNADLLPAQDGNNNLFDVKYPYVEREFYFTTDNSASRFVSVDLKLRIPDRTFPSGSIIGRYDHQNWPDRWQTQKFIADMTPENSRDASRDPPIAPILPGRYGVIGSAGTKYVTLDPPNVALRPFANSYTTVIGRQPSSDGANPNTPDDAPAPGIPVEHKPDQTRRIELRPSLDPNVNQLFVTGNGGYDPANAPAAAPNMSATDLRRINAADIGRSNEVINANGTPKNIYDADGDGNFAEPVANNDTYYQPCVAIPVEGFNISEPPWGWSPRELEAAIEEQQRKAANNPVLPPVVSIFGFDPDKALGEGRYYQPGEFQNINSYDVPFDTAPELMRTGTTANYRTIHLQRLANPLLPWNPPPKKTDGTANPDHRPNLPVNPYRTVDTSSVDLTAFNGASKGEGNYPDPSATETGDSVQLQRGQFRPWIHTESYEASDPQFSYKRTMEELGTQIWNFKSLERGAYNQISATHLIRDYTDPNVTTARLAPFVQRILQVQEPVPGTVADLNPNPVTPNGYIGVRDGRYSTSKGMTTVDMPQPLNAPDHNRIPDAVVTAEDVRENHVNMVLEHSLGFGNESYGQLYDRPGPPVASDAPTLGAIGAPKPFVWRNQFATRVFPPTQVLSTFPWLAWGNRPFVSAEETLNAPAASSAQLMRQFTTIGATTANPYNGVGVVGGGAPAANAVRMANFASPFGHLLNVFLTSNLPASVDISGADPMYTGAPHFYRILENIHVPSRYVGTETLLNAETFNDVPAYLAATEPIGAELTGLADARYNFQPPFNTVSRERDPGQVNLNTVTGRRFVDPSTGVPRIWSDVYDGIMHRHRDGNTSSQFGHLGPAWRDVVLSRKGYAQYNADDPSWDQPIEKPADLAPPDVFQFGLNYGFPTVFANPFRSPDAGSLVPIVQMMQHGVDASWLRVHPRTRNNGKDDDDDSEIDELDEVHDRYWGDDNVDDDGNGLVDDAREAGLHLDGVSHRGPPSSGQFRGVPEDQLQGDRDRERVPLFSEETISPFADGDRNPYMMYQPMSRLGNLVTNRSNVYAIWITVGYFEVEPAPNWNDSDDDRREAIRRRFGATDGWDDNNDPTTVAALALYNRVYPDGYMLGREVGSDTGDVKRPRGFYIVDRSEEVGFKPGEDLNVEKTIRLRRRIE